MSNEDTKNENIFTLGDSGDEVFFKELNMRSYDELNNDKQVTAGNLFAYPKYLDLFIEKVTKKNGEIIEPKGFRTYYQNLSANDGLSLLTKIDLIFTKVRLVLKKTGLAKEREDLVKQLIDTDEDSTKKD